MQLQERLRLLEASGDSTSTGTELAAAEIVTVRSFHCALDINRWKRSVLVHFTLYCRGVQSLRRLLEQHPRLDGCALSLWKGHVVASGTPPQPVWFALYVILEVHVHWFITGGDSEKAGGSEEAVRALRLAAETNPRSVRAQLTLAIHLLATAVRSNILVLVLVLVLIQYLVNGQKPAACM